MKKYSWVAIIKKKIVVVIRLP